MEHKQNIKKHNNTAHLESEQTSTKHESHIMYRCSNANHEPHTKTSNTIATKRNNNNEDKANAKHEKSNTRIRNTKNVKHIQEHQNNNSKHTREHNIYTFTYMQINEHKSANPSIHI